MKCLCHVAFIAVAALAVQLAVPASFAQTITSAVPHDVPGGQRLPNNAAGSNSLADFAWQQFLALCWQSQYNAAGPYTRGTADTSWNYSKPYTANQAVVWETFAHRSELRPYGVDTSPAATVFSNTPSYLYKTAIGTDIKPGTNSISGGAPSATLLNNLDEDNEIGSCNVYQTSSTGTVSPATQNVILYQAKVNPSEFNYIQTNFGAGQSFRNVPEGGTKLSPLNQAQTNAVNLLKQQKAPPTTTYNATTNPGGGIVLPAGTAEGDEGAIEIKCAFLIQTAANKSKLDSLGLFKTNVMYYTADANFTNWKYNNAPAYLLAIHIIHKTKSYPDFIFSSFEYNGLEELGFWYLKLTPLNKEYPKQGAVAPVTNENQIVDFNPYNAPNNTQVVQTGNPIFIKRQASSPPPSNNGELYPIPAYLAAINSAYQTKLGQLGGNNANAAGSIWKNYRLIGVQANITQGYSATPGQNAVPGVNGPTPTGPDHYLANHVIESDAHLGNFRGPGFGNNFFKAGPVSQVPGLSKGNYYGANVLYQGKPYFMAGCKGCHGVAQTSFGTDFSFLLDYGADKPVDQPDTIIFQPNEQ